MGRGVLVDYCSWAEKRGIEIKPETSHVISCQVVQDILKEENVTLKVGDILIIRSGLIKMYNSCTTDTERNALTHSPHQMGLEPSEETVRWLWNNHFSAVAGDATAFEVQPFVDKWCKSSMSDITTVRADIAVGTVLHDYLLVWWGSPIGEMWDLEALAEKCKKFNRWTFFLTSSPFNIQGGVASPPNAIAVF